jgi:ACS family tartrate transporter-like MFS transporter
VLYLTYWFPARQRARAVALLMAASPLVWMLGGPLSGALLELMHERAGLKGWQWVFLLEGLPAVALGVVTLIYLTDRPEQARWLTPEERAWLVERMAKEERHQHHHHSSSLLQAAADRRTWHLIALASTIALGISGMSYYFPRLIQDRFPALNSFEIGLLTAVAGTSTLLSIVAVGSHSDRSGERRWHVAGPAFLAAAGWALSVWREVPLVSFLGLVLAQAAMMSMWGTRTACGN